MNSDKLTNFEDLYNVAKSYNIEINNNQLILFKRYYEILMDWNTRINLISRKEENIPERHFLDSILFLPEIENLCMSMPYTPTIFDIGSGGGFPAIPLAIMNQSWQFVLCESIKKKANFLSHLVKELNLNNVEVLNTRTETCHGMSQQYDLITARAVAKLDKLIKYSLPLLKKGGYLLAYKAKEIDEELLNAKKIIKKSKLNLKILSKDLNGVERRLVIIGHCKKSA